MNLELTSEMILKEIKYTVNESSIKQVNNVIKNTNGFDKFAKHIISLNDKLKHMNAYIALSNNSNFFKIKCDNNSESFLSEFHDEVKKWSNKYNISLETIPNKEVYYILGVK